MIEDEKKIKKEHDQPHETSKENSDVSYPKTFTNYFWWM